jgi:muramoyltetrapeptide carboxypeptidase
MYPPRLRKGETIGIVSPSRILEPAVNERIADVAGRLGYSVKFGANVFKDTDGYIASARERADDINAMASDSAVKMVFFPGGEGAAEVLPLLDYAAIGRNPKIYCSYSDGTSILNAIHAQTGLITYHGMTPGQFKDLRYYDWVQFNAHFAEGYAADAFISDSRWKTLHGGACEGTLIGGYAMLFGLMLSNRYFTYDTQKKYILFLEDHERYSQVGAVNTYVSFIEQSALMGNVAGLVFGHYAESAPEDLLQRLARFGRDNGIPVVYTDDFGHGTKHAVLPIGAKARLDADGQGLWFIPAL